MVSKYICRLNKTRGGGVTPWRVKTERLVARINKQTNKIVQQMLYMYKAEFQIRKKMQFLINRHYFGSQGKDTDPCDDVNADPRSYIKFFKSPIIYIFLTKKEICS